MRIGIDIDGVLINDDEYILDLTSKYCFENNLKGFTDPYEYEYRKLSWSKETINDYRNKYFDDYVDNVKPRRFVSEIIKKLKEDNHEIYIITGRYKSHDDTIDGENMRFRIKKWLEKNEIIYDKLLFARVPKVNEIKKYKIDLMIEDSVDTINKIKDIVKVFCFDTRYNQNLSCKNVTKVFSWYDIYMKIKDLENNKNG